MKRGNIVSQLFLIVLAIIILSLILYFGYNALMDFKEKNEVTGFIRFKAEFVEDIDSMSKKPGSTMTKEYTIPAIYTDICFIDKRVDVGDIEEYKVIEDYITRRENDNVFFFTDDNFETMTIGGLEISDYPYYICVQPSFNKLKIMMTGKGGGVIIKTPPNREYCQNAQDGLLCDGLNIVFGDGYKEGCCSNYGLCC